MVAIELGLHRLTEYEVGKAVREMLLRQPSVTFGGVQPGSTYLYRPQYGKNEEVFRVIKTSPQGRKLTVAKYPKWYQCDLFRRQYEGSFHEMNDTLMALLGVTPRQVVEAAVQAGEAVPPQVRIEHPDLFAEIPERFGKNSSNPTCKTAADRVRHVLKPWMSMEACSAETVDRWIEEAHRSIAGLTCCRTQRVAINPDLAGDYDRYIEDYMENIDFYRWLRPLVAPGGVFHIPPEEA